MFTKFFSILFLGFSLIFFAQTGGDLVIGHWLATDNSVAVTVFKDNGEYRAKGLWFDDRLGSGVPMEKRRDTDNPDQKLRTRKIIGMEILEGLKYDPRTNSWENGRIYDATSGRHWDSSATIKNDIMKVRGFWKFKWIGKSISFRKINNLNFTKN